MSPILSIQLPDYVRYQIKSEVLFYHSFFMI
jgi:hypothetical protein